MTPEYESRGFLLDDYRLFHLSEPQKGRVDFHYHEFCKLLLLRSGSGGYWVDGQRYALQAGDVVFIPERIFCYSEWYGTPHIEVVYLSCFIHYEAFLYEPQILRTGDGVKETILQIAELLTGEEPNILSAYSRFYALLGELLPGMSPSNVAFDKHLTAAIEYMTEHFNERFAVGDLARHCCVSESTLYHLFQRELGTSPVQFLNSIRINIAIEHLENSHYSVSTVSSMVGFSSENHFRRIFREHTGLTPAKYRRSR